MIKTLSEERRNRIIEILNNQKKILVADLSELFETSEVTIRKDLDILEKRGLLRRVHGGAMANGFFVNDLSLNLKERIHLKEKQKIADKAASLIKEGDVVILDSGSTTTQLARNIKYMNGVTVITNAINIASELAASELEVILTGGILREKSFSLVGPIAEDTLRSITADKLFLGVDGFDFEYGITTPNILEAKVNQLMIKASVEVILLTDSSKFGKRAKCVIADTTKIQKIITDKNIKAEDLQRFKDMGIQVFAV